MKLSILPLAVASAGLLASASPMRVVIVSSSVQTHNDGGPVAQVFPPPMPMPLAPGRVGILSTSTTTTSKQHAPCGAGRLRQKAVGLSKALMSALGFSTTEKHAHVTENLRPIKVESLNLDNDNMHLPVEGKTPGGDRVRIMPMSAHPHPERVRFHHHMHHREGHSFLMRVHYALMSLGPWEGRAVAFVLGCGIGVLLRMFWVLTVISYRLLRAASSPSQEEQAYEYTVVDVDFADAEELFVAPPQYVLDEKAPARAEVQPAAAEEAK